MDLLVEFDGQEGKWVGSWEILVYSVLLLFLQGTEYLLEFIK
jgi:hypothetical protein